MANTWIFVLAILIGIAKRNVQLAGIALLNLTLEVNETTWWFGRRQLQQTENIISTIHVSSNPG